MSALVLLAAASYSDNAIIGARPPRYYSQLTLSELYTSLEEGKYWRSLTISVQEI